MTKSEASLSVLGLFLMRGIVDAGQKGIIAANQKGINVGTTKSHIDAQNMSTVMLNVDKHPYFSISGILVAKCRVPAPFKLFLIPKRFCP